MRLNWVLFTLLFAASGSVSCQDLLTVPQMKQILDVSERRGQLEMEGAEPFHLVASFEWFDVAGKPLGKGALDELWISPKQYRKSINLPDKKLLEVDNGTQLWRTGEWAIFQSSAMGMVSALIPFYERPGGDRLSIEAPPKDNSNLDCIGTEPDLPGVSVDTRLALTTYCVGKGNHLLRLISRPNSIEIAFNDIQPFGHEYIARTIQVAAKGRAMLRLHVDTLEPTLDSSSLEIPPPAGAQLMPFHRADMRGTTGEIKHAQLLSKVSPQYPKEGLHGKLVVKLHIDTTGTVASADVVSAENQILRAPVLTAVKQWKYRAAYQGDKVIEDDQTIVFEAGREDAQ